jgi:hypothetical protein
MAQPPKEKQEPPVGRRNWVGPVGADTGFNSTAAFARAGFSDPTLVLRWDDIAGPEVARLARPVRLSGDVLTLMAEPGAALFLGHDQRSLTARINAYLGRQIVARVKFIQGRLTARPAPPPPHRPANSLNPGDPAGVYQGPERLREALHRLARWRTAPKVRGD